MTSQVGADMDKDVHNLYLADKACILSRMEDELAEKFTKDGEIYDKEVLYWSGYLYRFWQFATGEDSKEIYKQAPAKTMNVVYLMYHTIIPELAIDGLKEVYANKGVATYITFQFWTSKHKLKIEITDKNRDCFFGKVLHENTNTQSHIAGAQINIVNNFSVSITLSNSPKANY